MKRFLKLTGYLLLGLGLLAVGGTWVQQLWRHADAAPEALAAAVSDADILIESGRFLSLRPQHVAERMGVIVYPGAYVDVRGYIPTLRPVAAAGYRVVIVPMPLELAVLGINRALDVQAANPDLHRWALIGHSVGGSMAAAVASRHPDAFAGIIIWDSYPPSFANLAGFPKPVWHIHRATPDGLPPPSFAAQRALFPAASPWVPIRGGLHMYFGSFGPSGYREDWAPSITRDAQQSQIARATLQALAAMQGSGSGLADP